MNLRLLIKYANMIIWSKIMKFKIVAPVNETIIGMSPLALLTEVKILTKQPKNWASVVIKDKEPVDLLS